MSTLPAPGAALVATLRAARAGDADRVAEIHLTARRTAMPWLARPHTDEETRTWVRGVLVPSGAVTVAERQGQVAGYTAVTDGWLEHLYVDPAEQGRGIGSRAVRARAGPGAPRLPVLGVPAQHARPGVLRAPRLRGGAAHHRRGQRGARARRVPQVGADGLTPGSALAGGRLRPGDLGGVLQRPGVQVGVAGRVPSWAPAWALVVSCSSSASTVACWSTQSTTRSPGLARAMQCRTASISSRTISTWRQRAALGHPGADALGDQLGRHAPLAAAQPVVLADDDDVEVVGRHRAELAHVVVPPVAGGADHADPRGLGEVGLPGLLVGVAARRSRRAPACRARCGSSRRRRRRCARRSGSSGRGRGSRTW